MEGKGILGRENSVWEDPGEGRSQAHLNMWKKSIVDGTRWGKGDRAEFSWAAGRVGANHEVMLNIVNTRVIQVQCQGAF